MISVVTRITFVIDARFHIYVSVEIPIHLFIFFGGGGGVKVAQGL